MTKAQQRSRIRGQESVLREVAALMWSQASPLIRRRFLLALLLVVGSGALTPLGPVALKLIVDRFTGEAGGHALSLSVLVGLYVLSQWLSRSAGELRTLAYSSAERRMVRTLSERMFSHAMRLPFRYHVERQTGVVTQSLENGLQGYQRIMNHLVFTLLPVCVQLVTTAVILLRFDHAVFFAIFCGAMLCYAVAFSHFAGQVSTLSKAASAARGDANGAMTDCIMNYETVKLFAAEEVVQDKVSKALGESESRWVQFYRRSATNGLIVATLHAGALAAAIVYAVHEVRADRMTVGDFVLVNTYMLQVLQPLESMGRAVQAITQGLGMLDRMLQLFREPPERLDDNDGDLAAAGRGELEFDHVRLSYRSERTILNDVSFALPAGRTLGIVGASGAGKSTIVRLLVRLVEPDGGRILLDGIEIATVPLQTLRRAIAIVPQDTVLFNDTLAYNIGLGRPGSSRNDIERAARLAHLDELVKRLPEGLETRVGERGIKLSGGERQRVSIARAALKRPRIYIFDEATSSLDSRTEREILQNLREISQRCTTLVIAHRLSTVVHADEIVVLHEGTIVERGTHAQLVRSQGRYSALWKAQQTMQAPAAS
ncbi:MAG TPA: ATP-binding cassette domain-containing protein [Steroidobacter sp.]|uniref:ATP-binding cassette domain-containing protein n=1 Tax=Steroidobacter sp. TaxID=1978227 RepID=UPI002ED948C8